MLPFPQHSLPLKALVIFTAAEAGEVHMGTMN
jgi:hypothetical protein